MAYYRSQSVSHKVFWALVIAAVAITPSIVLAKKTIVVGGKQKGWALGFDYQEWANGKTFHVGDELVFKYNKEAHNVYKVSKDQFDSCNTKSATGYTSGRDTIQLDKAGKTWFVCGVGDHCQNGQKLVIDVKPRKDN